MTTYSFDLLSQPWIPCTDQDGVRRDLSVREVLHQAPTLLAISDDSPLTTLALHRLLLAILHRALRGPRDDDEWLDLWERTDLPVERIEQYLEAWTDRFDLFHLVHPFFQIQGLSTVDAHGTVQAPVPAARLSVERATGNNAVLFDHALDGDPEPLSRAEAARALVTAQALSLGGGQGPTTNRFGKHPYLSHATQVGGVAVLLQGVNVRETLISNLVRYDDQRPFTQRGGDMPVWERSEHRPPGTALPDGYVDYLTLPCRYIALIPEGPSDSPHVRWAYITPGLTLPRDDDSIRNPLWFYRLHPERGAVPMPLRLDRAVWRDSGTLFALPHPGRAWDGRPLVLREAVATAYENDLDDDPRLLVSCFGLANDKAKPLAWQHERIPAPVRILDDADVVADVARAVEAADDASAAMRKALSTLAYRSLETEDKKPDQGEVSRVTRGMIGHSGFWDELNRPFSEFMIHVSAQPDEAFATWLQASRRAARVGFTRGASCVQGRRDRRLRALALAEQALLSNLSKLNEKYTNAPNEEEAT